MNYSLVVTIQIRFFRGFLTYNKNRKQAVENVETWFARSLHEMKKDKKKHFRDDFQLVSQFNCYQIRSWFLIKFSEFRFKPTAHFDDRFAFNQINAN